MSGIKKVDAKRRALELARTGSNDHEIAVALRRLAGWTRADAAAFLAEHAAALEDERAVGRVLLREHLMKLALRPKATSETIRAAIWASRQVLGWSPGGLQRQFEAAQREADGKPSKDLAAELRAAADELDPPQAAE